MTDAIPDAAQLPGFRRHIMVEVRAGAVAAMLEDDVHCLGVILRHDGAWVTAVEPQFDRLPWDTCPGAQAKLVETFSGQLLAEVTARRDKKQNCTHFHDLAVLAAAHAGEPRRVIFEIAVSDPSAGERILQVRRNGALLHRWTEQDGVFTAPTEIAGKALFTLRDWIARLSGLEQEAARLLQWASIVAHARTIPIEQQSVASDIPPNCYSFQPERAVNAVRNGERRDFSDGRREPLAGFGEKLLAAL